jgi:hypothetical protein
VPYDDPAFGRYLKTALGDLESQVERAVFEWEYEKLQRQDFERQLELNTNVVNRLREQADVDADRIFERVSREARRKVRSQ